ncbi:amidohydrolase family domain protein [Mycobacterium xenopi 3993]|nr:amidohydrolase family domain protein [Mycobacterium xenopi 3993]
MVEHSAAEDPELTAAMIHALNQWMLEQWGYTYQDRLYMTRCSHWAWLMRRAASWNTFLTTAPRWR